MMKFGVEYNDLGEVSLKEVPRNLERYVPLYLEIIHELETIEKQTAKYTSPDYKIYTDPTFLAHIDEALEEVTSWLLEKDIFPEDILDPRESKVVDLGVIRTEVGSYYGLLNLPCRGIVLSTPQLYSQPYLLQRGLKRLRAYNWVFMDNLPTNYYIFLGKLRRKYLTQNALSRAFYTNTMRELLRDFEMSVLRTDRTKKGNEVIETGIKLKLDTKELNLYSPLRYILETRG